MFKGDIQATRSAAAPGATAIIAQPIRLKGIIVASDGTGAGLLELTTTSNTGATLFIADVPSGDLVNFGFPDDGILFPKGIFCKTKTNVTAYTLITDKYSGPNLTGSNG
jgi:selenophosphate synthase